MTEYGEEEYEVPLRDQRYFGAGIKRKRVQFIPPASLNDGVVQSSPDITSTGSAADRYLAIVLAGAKKTDPGPSSSDAGPRNEHISTSNETPTTEMCNVCNGPLTAHHDSSLPHQIRLAHSYPPSHLDRRRKGLAVLENQGWDPDSRLGLGAPGAEGRLHPVRASENPRRAGIGAKLGKTMVKKTVVKLDAGKVRVAEGEKRRKAEGWRNAFFRNEEVERYLGGLGGGNEDLDMLAFRRARQGG